jgi:hypothetical protein
MSTTARKSRVWGVWEPVPDEALPPGKTWARPLEWWPSQRAAEASLRARVPGEIGMENTDTERRADGTVRTDAQYYGSTRSVIFLYRVQGDPGADPQTAEQPHAVLEFGPRGGVRLRTLVATQ